MAQHTPRKISDRVLEALLAGQGQPKTIGTMVWSVKGGSSAGEITAQIALKDCTNGRLRLGLKKRAPFQINFVYIVNDVAVYRVCTHKDTSGVKGTHAHRYIPSTGGEHPHSLVEYFPMIPYGTRPSLVDVRKAFEEFAALVNVELSEGYWSNPGEEVL